MALIAVRQAIAARGLKKQWVAQQMGIDRSYLSKLLSGDRPWTDSLEKRFAVAVQLSWDVIDFALECTLEVAEPIG